jgi:Lipocalin-like domain
MRTGSRSFSVLACAAFVAMIVFGCGDKSNPVSAGGSSIVGTWNLTTMVMGAITVTAGPTTLTDVETYNSDFTCKEISHDYMESPPTADTEVGTWTTSGNKLIVTSTGSSDTSTYAMSGNALTLTTPVPTYGSMTMTFARQ